MIYDNSGADVVLIMIMKKNKHPRVEDVGDGGDFIPVFCHPRIATK